MLSPPTGACLDCYFINALTGWVSGATSTTELYKTTNGGSNWIVQAVNSALNIQFYGIRFVNSLTGWAVGDTTILKTTNGGINWIFQAHPYVNVINNIYAISSDIAWVAASGTVLATTNGGLNWVSNSLGGNYTVKSIFNKSKKYF